MTKKEIIEGIVQAKKMKNPYEAKDVLKNLIYNAVSSGWYEVAAYGYLQLSDVCWKCAVISNFDQDKKLFFEQADMCRKLAQLYIMMREDRNIVDAYTSFFTYYNLIMQRIGEVFLIEYQLKAADELATKILKMADGEERFRYIEERVRECMKDIVGLVDSFVDQTDVREDFFQQLKQKWFITFQINNIEN